MPVTKGKLYDQFDTIGHTRRPDAIEAGSRQCIINEEVTLVGDEVATNVISLLSIPNGALVDLEASRFITSASTGLTFDLGTSADTDAYADGVALTSAGVTKFNANGVSLVEVTVDEPTLLTVMSGTAAATTFRVKIVYYIR